MHNIEKSKFYKGMYVGYGGGAVWHIRNYGKGNWKATPQGNNSHKVFTCASLRDVSTHLETAVSNPSAKEPKLKNNPDPDYIPRTYLSGAKSAWRIISDGMPLTTDRTTPQAAIDAAVAAYPKIKISNQYWDNETLEFVPVSHLHKRKTNPAPRKYRGKYPRNIKEIYSARVRGAHGVIVILNDGSRHELTASDTNGVPPELNENFDAFMAQVSASGYEPPSVRLNNPAKRPTKKAPSARKGISKSRYVSRPSQAPGHPAPSKRLKARRKKAVEGPAGYFPNPLEAGVSSGKAEQSKFTFHVQYRGTQTGKWNSIAAFDYKEDAFAYAKKLSRDEPGFTLRVMKDE